jgi:hypothetical protein
MARIIPTVGRKVWFYGTPEQAEPFDATVIAVREDGLASGPDAFCNLYVINDGGSVEVHKNVQVHELGAPEFFPCFRWMPYQKQQAEKAMS